MLYVIIIDKQLNLKVMVVMLIVLVLRFSGDECM